MLLRYLCLFAIAVLTLGGCQSASQSQPQPPAQESTASAPGATPTSSSGSESPPSNTQTTGSPAQTSNADGGGTASAPGSTPSSSTDEPPASEAEQAEVLDAQLDESLAVFDGMILEQGAQIEAIQNSSGSDTDGDGDGYGYGDGDADGDQPLGDQPLFEEGDLSADGANGNPPAEPAGDGSGAEGESTGRGTSTVRAGAGTMPGSGGNIPEDIPRGQDDDIVARQIREAAMQEKDPVLREKLWDEYRKYKNQQKAN